MFFFLFVFYFVAGVQVLQSYGEQFLQLFTLGMTQLKQVYFLFLRVCVCVFLFNKEKKITQKILNGFVLKSVTSWRTTDSRKLNGLKLKQREQKIWRKSSLKFKQKFENQTKQMQPPNRSKESCNHISRYLGQWAFTKFQCLFSKCIFIVVY